MSCHTKLSVGASSCQRGCAIPFAARPMTVSVLVGSLIPVQHPLLMATTQDNNLLWGYPKASSTCW